MKKLLIVVDYQNDFVNGALGFKGAEKLADVIKNKIEEYLNCNDDVPNEYVFVAPGLKSVEVNDILRRMMGLFQVVMILYLLQGR